MGGGGGRGERSLIWDKSMVSPIGCYENNIHDEKSCLLSIFFLTFPSVSVATVAPDSLSAPALAPPPSINRSLHNTYMYL